LSLFFGIRACNHINLPVTLLQDVTIQKILIIIMRARNSNHFTAINMLRCSIGLVYLWFGFLKFFPGLSPADQIARATLHCLTFGMVSDDVSIRLLATWECLLGIMLLSRILLKPALIFLFIHMGFTFSPYLLFPRATFQHLPYSFTLLGQYIFKNIIIICAGKMLWELDCNRLSSNERHETPTIKPTAIAAEN